MIKLPFGQLSSKGRLRLWREGKCPYCASQNIVVSDDDMDAGKTGTVYACQDCNAMNRYSSIPFSVSISMVKK